MLKIVKQDKNKVKEQVKKKLLDAIVSSNCNLIDEIILAMSDEGVLDCLSDGFPECTGIGNAGITIFIHR